MTLEEIEKKGHELLIEQGPRRSEQEVLEDIGLFGVHMAVIGLGVAALGDQESTGASLMKLGALIGAAGYGVRWLS